MDLESLNKMLAATVEVWAKDQPLLAKGESGGHTVIGPVKTETITFDQPEVFDPPEAERELPEGKRVVRTKAQGDRVFLLDEDKKTRHWVTSPEALAGQGFELSDVNEVEDQELLKYQMAAPIYK